MEPETVVVVRLGAMGDVIHALPAAAALRRRFPAARLRWAVEPRWAPLVEAAAGADGAVAVPLRDWRKAPLAAQSRREIREVRGQLHGGYTVAVDLQGLLKSGAVCWLAGAQRTVGFDPRDARESAAACFYSERVRATAAHVVDRYMEVARAAGAGDCAAEFTLPQGNRSADLPDDYVLMSPRAGWAAKEWPRDHVVALGRRLAAELGLPLVLDVAPDERGYAESIAAEVGDNACAVHASDLQGLVGATRGARAVVGVDSGPMHLAAALGKPGVAIFGPTDPARNGPYGGSLRVLRDAAARTSYKRNSRDDPAMSAVTPAQVMAVLREQVS